MPNVTLYVLIAWLVAVEWFAPATYRKALMALGLLCVAIIQGTGWLIVFSWVLFAAYIIEGLAAYVRQGGHTPSPRPPEGAR